MKKIKRITCALCALVMSSSAIVLSACGDTGANNDEAKTVMNLSLNPEVEFVLDGNDKVISVNALNEEGNLIISAEAFANVEGKSAEEAAKLFVQVSKDTGFLVSGSLKTEENEVEVSVSGSEADVRALYESVATDIQAYYDELGIEAKIEKAADLTKEHLEELVEECTPYLTEAEIEAMEYAELVKTLAESRKETAEFYSQEIKTAYYEAKARVVEEAKVETLKAKLNAVGAIAVEAANTLYNSAVEQIESVRLNYLIKEDSIYQKALASFREKKIEYLNYRNYVSQQETITTEQANRLAELDQLLETAETALEDAGETANALLDSLKVELTNAYNSVITLIESNSVKAENYLTEIEEAKTTALANADEDFEENYAAYKAAAKNKWASMHAELVEGYDASAN